MNPTERILDCFEKISAIPRGTKNEAGIRVWLQAWAGARGWESRTDVVGNLVILIPASDGYELQPTLILQGHMDMVCQKTSNSSHDFFKDPIRLVRDGDWLRALDTTLGADNGIAIALMMALVEDESTKHPTLELLLTVEEEQGLTGADNLDPTMLSGKTLINLDSEEDGIFTVGCAGGGSVDIVLPVNWKQPEQSETAFDLRVSGLLGGHSGGDINKQRANANKLLARILDEIQRQLPLRLSALQGGTARNAIPREAQAIFTCPLERADVCQEVFSKLAADIQNELGGINSPEVSVSLTLTAVSSDELRVIEIAETVTALRLLVSLPQGVYAMSAAIPRFVETSNNIGIVELKEDGLLIVSNHRSAVFSRLEETISRVESLAWLAGAVTERTKLFPPWQPDMSSVLLKKCIETYQAVLGETPSVQLAHGGLECGVISERCGGMDTLSLGPTVENPHSPDECMFIPSLARTWLFLTTLVSSLD